MSLLDDIEDHCVECGIEVEHMPLPGDIKAIYCSTTESCPCIVLDPSIRTSKERACMLAEELGHHYTTHGDILVNPAIPKTTIRKAETIARRWAFKYAVSLSGIVEAWDEGCRTLHDMADRLGVLECYLAEAIATYENIYGPYTIYGDSIITFKPVSVTR